VSVIGRTTEDQMHIGIYWGYVSMIEGLAARMKQEIGRPVKVISTGGLATLFDRHTSVFDSIEPDLTIQGLSLCTNGAKAPLNRHASEGLASRRSSRHRHCLTPAFAGVTQREKNETR
jgi:hypothetical protein